MQRIDTYLERLLAKTGGWYVILIIILAQFIALPGALLGMLSIRLNAEYTNEQLRMSNSSTLILLVLSYILILLISWFITRESRNRLTQWSRSQTLSNTSEDELRAWRQITSFSWRYGIIAFFLASSIYVIGGVGLEFAVGRSSQDQVIYSLMGGAVSVIVIVMLATLLIDRLLLPARKILTPKEFEFQIQGRGGILMITKFLFLVSALILIGILMVGPIGYHQTVTVLYKEIGSAQVLYNLQIQSVLVSLLTLALGSGLAYMVSRSISEPVNRMIDVFKKVEDGDLSQRADIMSTDETGELVSYFNRMISRLEGLQQNLEKQVQERTAQLITINEVGTAASSILDPGELISRVVHLISDRLGHYYAAIFLLDETGQWAELKDATGEAGKLLKQNKHKLEVNLNSMVGTTIRTREARIASDTGEEPARFDNPLLPYTRSEIALPLLTGDKIIGALDVQSTQKNAFGAQDIDTLQGMANQVAISLENARLFQEAQQSLHEMRSVQKQYLQEAWKVLPRDEGAHEYSAGDQPREKVTEISLPLSLRGQELGEINIEADKELSPDERNLIEAVAKQASVALENARLLEETQRSALHEKIVADIINKIWASTTVNGILKTAIRELGQSLDASDATIEIELKPQ